MRRLLVAVACLALVLSACAQRGAVGNAERCPDRNAYCPADGPGVAAPERPAASPSGAYRLEVSPGDEWHFRVLDAASGEVAFEPPAGEDLDGGIGTAVLWEAAAPATVWAVDSGRVRRWQEGDWQGETVTGGTLPADVQIQVDAGLAAG
jgi:hypothetical protein